MAVIAYIRVSSNKQTHEHQRYEINQFAIQNHITVDKWVEETISSRKPLNKRALGNLLDQIQDGDTLIACEISRLGRSLLEVMDILKICLDKNCKVWTLKENYQLGNDIQSKVLAFAFGLAAEIERTLISQRTKASLENVRASGKRIGRPLGKESRKLKLNKNTQRVRKLLDLGISRNQICRIMNVQPITLRRFIKRMGW